MLFKKHPSLRSNRHEVEKYVDRRLQEVEITSDLKQAIEREVVSKFANRRPQHEDRADVLPQRSHVPRPTMPQQPQQDVDNLSQLSVREVPADSKPQDIYSIITKMNANLEMEDETRKKRNQKSQQQI